MDDFKNKNGTFEESLKNFSATDANKNDEELKRSRIKGLFINSILTFIFIALFIYAGYMLLSYSKETGETIDKYEEIRPKDEYTLVAPSTRLPEPTPMYTLSQQYNSGSEQKHYEGDIVSLEDEQRRRLYYNHYISFRNSHSEAFGWIYVSGTNMDYPIMKSADPDYYLTHDFNGNVSSAGSIFADIRLSDDNYLANKNVIINGHCMKNGTMFRSLKTFMESANRNVLAKNMVVEIYRPEGLYLYSVLSGYRDSTSSFMRARFQSDDEYYQFLNQAVKRNILSVSHKYDASSNICTLVTCANVSSNKDERYVLQCILTSFIPKEDI